MRILIVDDNERVRRTVAEVLSLKSDCEVCGEAKDGVEAIQKAVALLPDLVLLDISMPGVDGLAVARRLRTEVPTTRIVIMSQHDPDLLLPLALAAGADGCLDKSRLQHDLRSIIGHATSGFKKDEGSDPHNPLPKTA